MGFMSDITQSHVTSRYFSDNSDFMRDIAVCTSLSCVTKIATTSNNSYKLSQVIIWHRKITNFVSSITV